MPLDKDPNTLFNEGSTPKTDDESPKMEYDPYTGQPINDNNYTKYNGMEYPTSDIAMDTKAHKQAIISLIFGIVGLVLALSCCCSFFSIVFSIVGLIFGILSRDSHGQKSGMAIAGIICSIIGMVVFLIVIIGTLFYMTTDSISSSLNNSGFGESFDYFY